MLGLLLGLTLGDGFACSGGARTMALDNDDSGRTVSLSAGDELDITLGSIGNQGDPAVSSTVLRYQGSAVIGPANPGGPTILYKFTAVASGTATITIPFVSPANPPPFTVDVNVD